MKLRSRLAVLATVPIVLAACSINVYEEGSFAGGGGGGGGEGAAVDQEPDTGEIVMSLHYFDRPAGLSRDPHEPSNSFAALRVNVKLLALLPVHLAHLFHTLFRFCGLFG